MKEFKIIYHLQNESENDEVVVFSTRVRHGDNLTLADFKTITNRIGYRYYFLALDSEFGLIKTAIESNREILPSFSGIIEAWLFEEDQSDRIVTDKIKSLRSLSKKTPSWKRLLDLIDDFEATHRRKNKRVTELELSTSSVHNPERLNKQHETREYLETSFFHAEPIEIDRVNYSRSNTGSRNIYPISSSPIRHSCNHDNSSNTDFTTEQTSDNLSSGPEFWSIRSKTTKRIFTDGNFISDIDRSNRSSSKSYGSFSKSESQSFGNESTAGGQKPTKYDLGSEINPNELEPGGQQNEDRTSPDTARLYGCKHEEAVLRSAQASQDITTGVCKQHPSAYVKKKMEWGHGFEDDISSNTVAYFDIATGTHQQHSSTQIKSKMESRQKYEQIIPSNLVALDGVSTGACKQRSGYTNGEKAPIDPNYVISARSYVDLTPPSGQSDSKEESKFNVIKSDMLYFRTSNQDDFGDESEPDDGGPHNNTKESDDTLKKKWLIIREENTKIQQKQPKIRRPLQYVNEPEALHNNVADTPNSRHDSLTRNTTGPKGKSPVKPPRIFEYVRPNTKTKMQNPFREIGTKSIQIGNLTSKSRTSFGSDGSVKPKRCTNHQHDWEGQRNCYKISYIHQDKTRACSGTKYEQQPTIRNGEILPDVCLSLLDVSMMRRCVRSRREQSSNASQYGRRRLCTLLDNFGYHRPNCLHQSSVTSLKNLTTPGNIPSSCLSLCNYNMNRSSSSVCGSSRHFVNTERKLLNDREFLEPVDPSEEISDQIEQLTSDCEVCRINDKNSDDLLSESVLSLYDFQVAETKISEKRASARNLHKESMACCRYQ